MFPRQADLLCPMAVRSAARSQVCDSLALVKMWPLCPRLYFCLSVYRGISKSPHFWYFSRFLRPEVQAALSVWRIPHEAVEKTTKHSNVQTITFISRSFSEQLKLKFVLRIIYYKDVCSINKISRVDRGSVSRKFSRCFFFLPPLHTATKGRN